jgi:hypothetical protein
VTGAAKAVAALVVAGAVALGAPACGNSKASPATAGVSGKAVKPLDAGLVPSDVLGLNTAQEDVSKALATGRRSFVGTTSVYSFRKGDLLQATLQVSRFLDGADWQSQKFKDTLVAGIGGVKATLVRVGDRDVYLTAANQQRIAIWFRGPYMFIVATREDFGEPRALVRKLLEIAPT